MKIDFTALFCPIDDFCQSFEPAYHQRLLADGIKRRRRRAGISTSEMMTIVIAFHQANFRTFKHFYLTNFTRLRAFFPGLPSYSRFIQRMPRILLPLMAYTLSLKGEATGSSFVDSTSIQVCSPKRIYRHKVFKGIAQRGKTTKGWFYGFKLHLVINELGEMLAFQISPGNVDDRVPVPGMSKELFGKLYGDKGYISAKLARRLLDDGIELITSIRHNMKNRLMSMRDKLMLRKRSLIETVNDQLKNISQIEHSRHRSPTNFMINLLAGLAAYCFQPKKPAITPLPQHQISFA